MFEIALLGDISFNGIISAEPQKNQERFEQVCQVLDGPDLVFANLEVPVGTSHDNNQNKSVVLHSDKKVTLDLLKRLNISCVSLANNHIFDFKMDGLRATIEMLEETGIFYTGAGWKKEHLEPVIINKDGSSIGFMAYVDRVTNPGTESFQEFLINYFEPEKVIADLARLRGRVDKIICSIHWGVDYSNFFTKEQQNIARRLINEGVDIIMGHHSHTIQPYEELNGKYIFYSLGQLCFGDFVFKSELKSIKRKTKLGIIPIIDSTDCKLELIPTRESRGNYIEISKVNITKKLKRLFFVNRLMIGNRLVKLIFAFKESFIDRLYEFFFGYYRNPFRALFKLNFFKKVNYIFRDYKTMR